MKKLLLASLFFVPSVAFGSVTIDSVTVPQVEPGQTVTVTVDVTRTLVGPLDPINATNDWKSSAYRIDSGSFVCKNTPNFTLGNGTSTASFSFTATSTEGVYDLDVRVYALDNCIGQQDSQNGSDNHEVAVPPPSVTPSSDEPVSKAGGGGFMHPCYYLQAAGVACAMDDKTKAAWANSSYREWAIGLWRAAMCRDHGAFCR